MSPQSNSLGFMYIDQNGLLIFTTTTPAVLQFPFPPDIVRDLEIINKDLLKHEFLELIKNNALQPSRYIFALSDNVLFEKPFQDSKSPETEKEIQGFLDNMPFEHTATIIFENAVSKIIATNKDLYQTIVRLMSEEGSTVEYIFPSYILGIDVNQALGMNQSVLSEMHRRAPSLRQYSFIVDPTAASPSISAPGKPEEEKSDGNDKITFFAKNKRTVLLVGVFVVLLLILVVVFFAFQGK